MFPTILSFFPLLILSSLPLSKALVNLTIDDQDTKISYIPRSSWTRNHITGWDYGDTHMWTTDPDAYATITMKFVSFYVLAPKWPYKVMSYIRIDNRSEHLMVDMQDYHPPDVNPGPTPTIGYSVVASWIGTASEEHTLWIKSADSYGIVDALIFEVLDPNCPSSTSNVLSGPFSNSSSSEYISDLQGLIKRLVIVVAVLSAVLAIVLVYILWWFCIRKSQKGVPYTGAIPGPPIDNIDSSRDGYDPHP